MNSPEPRRVARPVRNSLTQELRRVLARLGGTPEAHATPMPRVVVSQLSIPAADTPRAVALELDAEAWCVEGPGAHIAGLRPTRVECHASPLHRTLAAVAHLTDPAPPEAVARRATLVGPVRESAAPVTVAPPPLNGGPVTLPPPESATAALEVERVTLHGDSARLSARGRVVRPLPARARVARRWMSLPREFFLVRRKRIPATTIERGRLAQAWSTLLGEHPVIPADVAFVGVYGPFALGTVVGARVESDGRLLAELRPQRVTGPIGDLIIGLHQPTGTVLRSGYPRDGGPRRRLR